MFTEEEKSGFLVENETAEIKQIDLLTLTQSPIDFYRDGAYPIVRGTVN